MPPARARSSAHDRAARVAPNRPSASLLPPSERELIANSAVPAGDLSDESHVPVSYAWVGATARDFRGCLSAPDRLLRVRSANGWGCAGQVPRAESAEYHVVANGLHNHAASALKYSGQPSAPTMSAARIAVPTVRRHALHDLLGQPHGHSPDDTRGFRIETTSLRRGQGGR